MKVARSAGAMDRGRTIVGVPGVSAITRAGKATSAPDQSIGVRPQPASNARTNRTGFARGCTKQALATRGVRICEPEGPGSSITQPHVAALDAESRSRVSADRGLMPPPARTHRNGRAGALRIELGHVPVEASAAVGRLEPARRREIVGGGVARREQIARRVECDAARCMQIGLGARTAVPRESDRSIALARSLSMKLNIPATFVCADVLDLPHALSGQFDMVFTSYGVLHWLRDLKRWAEVVAHFLKPGGIFLGAENLTGTKFHLAMRMKRKRGNLGWRYLRLSHPTTEPLCNAHLLPFDGSLFPHACCGA